jgi:deoxyribonuclease-4
MRRAQDLGIPYMVLHPGSHRGSGVERGLARLAASLDETLSSLADPRPGILLETTAGQGDGIGGNFEELARVIERSRFAGSLGVCLDTCHVFAAGYDIRTKRVYERTLGAFDRVLGLDRLKAFHLNDSLKDLGSRVDRHTHIGEGKIGLAGFSLLVNDARFLDRPMVLETPKGPDDANDIRNLAVLRGLRRPAGKARSRG